MAADHLMQPHFHLSPAVHRPPCQPSKIIPNAPMSHELTATILMTVVIRIVAVQVEVVDL